MPIDPTIALGVRPPQFQNPLELYMQQAQMQDAQNRNALAQYTMRKAQQEDEARNALTSAYQGAVGPDGNIDRHKLFALMAGGRAAGQIPTVQKSFAEADEKQVKTEKEKVETALKQVDYFRKALVTVNDPQTYQVWRSALAKAAPQFAQTVPMDFNPQTKAQLLMTADQIVERLYGKLVESDEGGQKTFRNPYTGEQAGPTIQKTMGPGEKERLGIEYSRLNLEKDRAKQEQLSQPFEVQGPDGTNILVQQDKKSGQLYDVNTKQAVGGVAPKMSADAQGSLRDVNKLKSTLDKMITSYKPEYVGAKGMLGEFADQYGTQAPLIGDKMGDKNRVQFRQLASTVVNDYIKAITGATVGQSGEQQRLMRAVPAPSDSDLVFKAKMEEMRRNLEELPNIIAGKKPQAGGWSIKRLD